MPRTGEETGPWTTIEADASEVEVSSGGTGSGDLMARKTRIHFNVGRTRIQIIGTPEELEQFRAEIAALDVSW